MNKSTQKSPGQTLFHRLGKVDEAGISLWEYLSHEVRIEWENAAQAILSHKSPDGGDGEWEEFTGRVGNKNKFPWVTGIEVLIDGEWEPTIIASSDHDSIGNFSEDGLYRRPRQAKEESQTTNKEEDYDRSIHHNPDAREWARFFNKTCVENGWQPFSEDLMHTWFANAMMAMHDFLKSKEQKESQPRGGQEMATPEKSKTIVQLCAEIAKQEGELNATKRERDEARAQLVEMTKSKNRWEEVAKKKRDQEIKNEYEIHELQSQLTTAKAEVEKLKESEAFWHDHADKRVAELTQLRQTQDGRLTGELFAAKLREISNGNLTLPAWAVTKLITWLNAHLTSPWTAITGPETLPTHLYSVLGFVTSGPLVLDDPFWDVVSYEPKGKVWLQSVNGEDVEVNVSHWLDLPDKPLPTPEPEKVEDDAQLGLVKRLCNEVDNLRVKLKNGEKEGTEGYQRRSVLNRDVQQWLAAQEKGKV